MKQSLPTLHDIINNLDIYGMQIHKKARDMDIEEFKWLLNSHIRSEVLIKCSIAEYVDVLNTDVIEEYVDTLSSLKLRILAAGISITIIPSAEDMNTALKSL